MMEHGPIRLKKLLSVGGRAQKVVSCAEEMDAFLEHPRGRSIWVGARIEFADERFMAFRSRLCPRRMGCPR
jgi:hypothetical protein